MSNEDLKQKLSVIISATNTSGNQKLDAIMELISTPSKELIHEYFDNCSTRPAAAIESKELKSAEQIITEQIGIRLDAPKKTPMDKGECIVCMEAYASQLHPSPTPDVEDGKQGGEVKTAEEIFEYMYQSFKGTRYSCEWWDDFKDLNSDIKECIIAAMDEYKSQPSTPVQDGWVDLVLACNRMIKAFDDAPVEWQQTQDVMDAEIAIRTALLTLPSPPVNKQD